MTPYYQHGGISIYHGDCCEVASALPQGCVDTVIADPPYGETSLEWDSWRRSWIDLIGCALKPECPVWVFGSFRMFFEHAQDFKGWSLAQEIIWEKQNGSSFHADRFKRVHELVVQFYQGDWASVYKNPVKTWGHERKVTRRKTRPPHTGGIAGSHYISEDGGPRLMRSVVYSRNCHGFAEHPTQKPEDIVDILLEYSAGPNALVFSPFLGSGTDLVVAKRRRLRAVGCDTNERFCEISARRLSQEVMQFDECPAEEGAA